MDGEEDEILEKGKRKKETEANSNFTPFQLPFPQQAGGHCFRWAQGASNHPDLLETLTFVFSTALKPTAAQCSKFAASHTTPA